jgi:hypothetical protein
VGRNHCLPTFGKDSYFWYDGYFWLVVLVVVVGLVFLVLCFLAFFAGAVVLWLVDWPVAGVFCPANVIGTAAAAKTIASKLFFMLVLLEGIYLPSIPSSGRTALNTIDSKG